MAHQSVGVGIVGPYGRMGRCLCDLLAQATFGHLAAVLIKSDLARERPAHWPKEVVICKDLHHFTQQPLAVIIDFSAPAICQHLAPLCAQQGIAYVVGSTGLADEDEIAMNVGAQAIPILHAANFSLGIAVLRHLACQAALALPGMDVEILEVHHRHKRDAPSGTAYMLAQALTQARKLGDHGIVSARQGSQSQRQPGQIGVAALRGGEVVGEHQIHLLGDHEQLCLTHKALSVDVFADGALQAAAWLIQQSPGSYTLHDMLATTMSSCVGPSHGHGTAAAHCKPDLSSKSPA